MRILTVTVVLLLTAAARKAEAHAAPCMEQSPWEGMLATGAAAAGFLLFLLLTGAGMVWAEGWPEGFRRRQPRCRNDR